MEQESVFEDNRLIFLIFELIKENEPYFTQNTRLLVLKIFNDYYIHVLKY